MNDMIGPTSDEEIYTRWEGGKSLRTLAREMGLSVMEVEQSVDRMLPVFDAQTNLRALKREIQQVEDSVFRPKRSLRATAESLRR